MPVQPTVVNNYHRSSDGGGGNGFFTGWLFGSMMNNHPQTVVVAPGAAPQVAAGGGGQEMQPAPAVAQPAPQGPGFFGWLLRGLVWAVLLGVFAVGLVGTFYLVKEWWAK